MHPRQHREPHHDEERARRDVALGVLADMEAEIGQRLGEDQLAAMQAALLHAWP